MSLAKQLEQLGLTEKEAKIYVALLEVGEATAQQLATKSGINRATTYVTLENLLKRGLASNITKKKKTYFIIESPQQILDFLDKEKEMGDNFLAIAKIFFLRVLDSFWLHHLEDMDWLRQSVKLRGYARLDPLIEYKTEGYKIFQEMMQEIDEAVVQNLIHLSPLKDQAPNQEKEQTMLNRFHNSSAAQKPFLNKEKIGRNDPCPCGRIDPKTGQPLKYKKCCWPKYDHQ